jgi:hypothetical protein
MTKATIISGIVYLVLMLGTMALLNNSHTHFFPCIKSEYNVDQRRCIESSDTCSLMRVESVSVLTLFAPGSYFKAEPCEYKRLTGSGIALAGFVIFIVPLLVAGAVGCKMRRTDDGDA